MRESSAAKGLHMPGCRCALCVEFSHAESRDAARSYRWWSLRPEFFRTEETPSAMRSVRYGFGLVKPDHTRRFLATLDRIDYAVQDHRSRGFTFDVRLFG